MRWSCTQHASPPRSKILTDKFGNSAGRTVSAGELPYSFSVESCYYFVIKKLRKFTIESARLLLRRSTKLEHSTDLLFVEIASVHPCSSSQNRFKSAISLSFEYSLPVAYRKLEELCHIYRRLFRLIENGNEQPVQPIERPGDRLTGKQSANERTQTHYHSYYTIT